MNEETNPKGNAMTAHEMTSSKEYKAAFSNWRKLHKYRYDCGSLGKKYNAAWKTLCEITKG